MPVEEQERGERRPEPKTVRPRGTLSRERKEVAFQQPAVAAPVEDHVPEPEPSAPLDTPSVEEPGEQVEPEPAKDVYENGDGEADPVEVVPWPDGATMAERVRWAEQQLGDGLKEILEEELRGQFVRVRKISREEMI